jgi:hypothetical protein
MDNNQIYDNLFSNTWQPTVTLGDLLKIPLIVLGVGSIFYSLMLLFKSRILIDTINSQANAKIKMLVYVNLLISVVTVLLATFIILLG